VEARHQTLTHDAINLAASGMKESGRAYQYVAELNRELLVLFSRDEKPIQAIRGERAYRLSLTFFETYEFL
jgi:hypothetical protein